MRGPQYGRAHVEFELKLVKAESQRRQVTLATRDYFNLRTQNFNEAMVSAIRSIDGPQVRFYTITIIS